MIEKVTSWADVLGCLAIAIGLAQFAAEHLGIGGGLIVFGAAILVMSAGVSLAAGRKRGGAG
ncbi:MAG TPA: hypothetical protein VFG99_07940 [Chloroflexia bacterium]|nr:hypothetical protein [Chloroflexia bacterium]